MPGWAMDRRSILVGYALSTGVMAWESYQIFLTSLFPLPLKVAFAILGGFLLVTFYFVWKYFAPASKPVPVTV